MRAHRYLLLAGLALMAGGCTFFPRMAVQQSVKPYSRDMPAMPADVVPTTGTDPATDVAATRAMPNPVKASKAAVAAGKTYYGYYCQHCHGMTGNSHTPVGDSYNPMPTRLDSPSVQASTDGELFGKMVLGVGHEPAMKATVPIERRWYIVHYVRTLSKAKR